MDVKNFRKVFKAESKALYIKKLNKLLESAKRRKTDQGVLLFETSICKIGHAADQKEFEATVNKLKRGLTGVEAHGEITDEEFACFQEIREIN